ncbi:hypothetical protein BOTBODRAFT_34444 [Neofusicoccum parvum]|uniref:Uncharacterized protein n=1 Tax=Neofusicoccum parvum TaxID=310453 RepID=A0ACB5SCC9_9PEZI|nr:hypothetical protein BOTBODRAFT_34444 [Neofusicoccum parvum]
MTASGSLQDCSVTVLSKHIIQCAHEESLATIPSPFKLGPLDQLVNLSVPIAVVFTYKSGIAVDRLQRALARLLDYYPHLTGRLHISEEDGTREMTALGSGAELLVAECTSRLDAFSSPVDLPGRGGNALCAPFDPSLEAVCRDPQFTIQHTRFACGGVALGVRLHHTLCDSDGFFQLVRDLAELYRSIGPDPDSTPGALAHPPCIRGYLSELLYDMPPDDRKAALEYQPSLFHVDPTPAAAAAPAPPTTISTPPPVVGRIIRISGAELAALKAHATNPNGSSWISTFDALAAHLWQTLYRARLQLRAASPSVSSSPLSTAFLTSVNHRARLPTPPHHFPNCLFTPHTTFPHADLATAPLWQLAQTMHALTRHPSAAAATATARWIAAQPDKRRIRWGFPGGEGAFMFSAWSKFDAYRGTAFEAGAPPVGVAQPFSPINMLDGLAYTLPTEAQGRGEEAEGVDLWLAVREPVWGVLGEGERLRRVGWE